jgi:hydrogenase maturation protease
MKRIRIIGCGSPDGEDDRAGLLAAEALRATLPPEIDVRQDPAGGVNIYAWCENVDLLVILDAAVAESGFPVGSFRRIDYLAQPNVLQRMQMLSTHVVSVTGALQLAEGIGILPPVVIVYAIAAERFNLGDRLSEPLRQAIDDVVQSAAGWVLAWLRDEPCTSSR